MSLDINTPKGQETLKHEQRAIFLFEKRYPGSKYISTNKLVDAVADGVVLSNGQITALIETKCRGMSEKQLEIYGNTWLITYEKVKRCVFVASELKISFYGFLYLVPDDTLIIKKIWENGEYKARYTVSKSETQKNVNGGKAIRENMFIDMSECVRIVGT